MLMPILQRFWKPITILLALVACLSGGYFWGKSKTETIIQEKIVQVEVQKQSEHKKTTKKTTQKPDGTVITEETDESKKDSESSSQTTASKDSHTKPALSKYKVGVLVHTDINSDTLRKPELDYSALVGARLGDLPIWVEGTYKFKDKSVGVGLSWEF